MSHAQLVGSLLGGRYRVLGLIGQGGMGAVYSAMQEDLQRQVAIKVLSPKDSSLDSAMRLRQEALAAAELRHPNIVQVTDFQAQLGEPPFLVMEALEGESLADLVEREAPLPVGRAVFIATQILAALQSAHGARIIHRDIKPANVFLSRTHAMTDLVKVLDFGIAKVLSDRAVGPRTMTGTILGTPAYMSPEQVVGVAADERADLYAVGVCLFEMLSRRRPYEAPTGGELMMAIARQPAMRLLDVAPRVDPALAAVISRSIAKDSAARYPSAVAMIEALAPWSIQASLGPGGGLAAATTPGPTQGPRVGHEIAFVSPTISSTSLVLEPAPPLPVGHAGHAGHGAHGGHGGYGQAPHLVPVTGPPATNASSSRSLLLVAAAVAGVLLVASAAAAGAFLTMRRDPSAASGGGSSGAGGGGSGPLGLGGSSAGFDSDVALTGAQLVGTGVEDLVAWSGGGGGGSKNAVNVYDGATLKLAWSLPVPNAPMEHGIAVAGSRVVVSTGATELSIVDGAKGAVLRKVTLPSAVESLCASPGAPKEVWLELSKHEWRTLDVDTGGLRDATVPPRGCAPADTVATTLAASDKAFGGRVARAPAVINGWDTKHCSRAAVCTERTATGNVFNEGLSDGETIVAMTGDHREGLTVTGLDAASKARWTKTLKPSTTGDPVVDLVGGRLFVQEVSQGPSSFVLEAIDAKTGVRAWRYEAPKSTERDGKQPHVSRSGAGPTRLYLLRDGHIDVLDLRTGSYLGTIG